MKIVKLRFHLFVSEEDVKENKNNLCHTYFVTCKFVNLLILKTFYLFVLRLDVPLRYAYILLHVMYLRYMTLFYTQHNFLGFLMKSIYFRRQS